MITKIGSLVELPANKDYRMRLLKTEPKDDFEGTGFVYEMANPKCFYLYIEIINKNTDSVKLGI